MRLQRRYRVALLVALLVVGCTNLHQVDEWMWRSAQPESDWLYDFLYDHDVDVILNARGSHPGQKEYDLEVATAGVFGTEVVGVPLSAGRRPTDAEVEEVLEVLRLHDEDTMLVHCRSGSDRTGMVIFLYLYEIRGWPKAAARKEALSWKYGHIPLLSPSTGALDEWAEEYE